MPSRGDTQINNFVSGLITEASPLSFPPGASLDEANMKLLRDGSRERRLGLDYEDDYALVATGLTADEIATSRQHFFRWSNPSGSTEVELGVIQIGTTLTFVDLFTANPSANVMNQGVSIDASSVSTVLDDRVRFDFTIVNDNLLVVSAGLDTPFLLSYDEANDIVSAETSRLKIRDLYGVDDGLEVNERPGSITEDHKYNLRNQGWNKDIVTTCGTDPLDCTNAKLNVYPSNSDTWSLGKIADVTDADIDKYEPETLEKNSFDLGRAARGHFVIDLYNRGQSRAEESDANPTSADREVGRVSTAAAYGGRVFYSGIQSKVVGKNTLSPKLSGAVLFSQVARSNEDLVKCYQEADPTSPTNSDIVDTDGGLIQVSGAANIVKIMAVKQSLFVFDENGVWEIRGDEAGFSATNFQVNKISAIGVFSPDSIVEANGTIFFFAKEGIFSLTPNSLGTGFDTTNLTISTIQKGYNTVPDLTKQTARGYYDVSNNTVRWLFRSDFDETLIVPDPDPIVTIIGSPSVVTTTLRQQPELAKISSTKAFMMYRENTQTQLYYEVLTVAADMTITAGAEGTVKASSMITSYTATTYGTDDKVLVIYRDAASGTTTNAMVGTVSGDTVTFGTPVALGTTFNGDLGRSVFESKMLESGKVLFCCSNTSNARSTLLVVEIDGSDTITFGTQATGTSTNTATNKLAIFSSTKGMVQAGGLFTNTSATTEQFTVTGTTVTFDGTAYTFTNNTQFPSPLNDQFFFGDVCAYSATQAFSIGSNTISGGAATTHGLSTFFIDESSGVLTSTTVLDEDRSWASSPTTTAAHCLTMGSSVLALYNIRTETPNRAEMGVYSIAASTPVRVTDEVLNTGSTVLHPNQTKLTDNVAVQAYTYNDGTAVIEAVAHQIT